MRRRRPALLFLLVGQLLVAPSVQANDHDDSVTFTVFDNGASKDGVEMTLSPSDFKIDSDAPPGEAFAIDMSHHVNVSKYKAPKPVIATRAFREDGELITSFEQLLPSDDQQPQRRVYLVAEGLEFIWPFVELGHNQTISPNVLPPTPSAGPVILESLSETPRVFRVYNMASEQEANALIQTALNATGDNALKRSTVGSGTDLDGKDLAQQDVGRTSDNTWDHESPEARTMITRSFQLTNIEENAGKRDGLQIVRYTPGQGYNTHPDYFTAKDDGSTADFDFNPYSGGSNRFATVFMYLNCPEEGGYTVFPRAPGIDVREPPQEALDMFEKGTWERTVTEQCYKKLGVPPKVGTAALFYSVTPDGRIEPKSHHAACPLIKGTKWGANIWIWNKQRFGDVRTGDARSVEMINDTGETVYISWEGKASGSIAAGRSMQMNSFEYHRFKASFGSHKNKAFADFTVQSEPNPHQTWEIKKPRQRNLEEQDMRRVVVAVNNRDKEKVCISWQGKEVVMLEPRESTRLQTFVGHSFDVSLGSCNEKPFSSFSAKSHPKEQAWEIWPDDGSGVDDDDEEQEQVGTSGGDDEEIEVEETVDVEELKTTEEAKAGKRSLKDKLASWGRKIIPGKKSGADEL